MTDSLRYEVVRLRTARSTGVLLAVAIASMALTTWVFTLAIDQLDVRADTTESLTVMLTQAPVAGLCMGLLGVFAIGGEHRFDTLSTTLLLQPRRSVALAAKSISVTAVAGFCGVITLGTALLLGLSSMGWAVGDVDIGSITRSAVIYLVIIIGWGLFGVGVTAVLGNQTAGLAALVGWPLVLEPATRGALLVVDGPVAAATDLLPFAAGNAAVAWQEDGTGSVLLAGSSQLHPLVSLLVFGSFVGGVLLAGARAFRTRTV